jgi:hypothetical protein
MKPLGAKSIRTFAAGGYVVLGGGVRRPPIVAYLHAMTGGLRLMGGCEAGVYTKKASRGGMPFWLLCMGGNYSPGAIAPEGQTSAQVPHSMQVSGSIL